jgi:hypothetical protein
MTTIRLQVAPRVGPDYPRGSRLAVALILGVRDAWAALRRPAAPPVERSDAAKEAQAVRELAWQYRQTDPGFASDLLAAADHHERRHGVE